MCLLLTFSPVREEEPILDMINPADEHMIITSFIIVNFIYKML